VTPLVRRLAADNDLDLAAVVGTGVGGRIRREDVLAAAEEATARRAAATTSTPVTTGGADTSTEPGNRTEKLSRLRRLIADRMLESITTTAQLTTVIEVDLTRVAALRNRFKAQFAEREGVKLTYLPFIAKAAIEALKLYPVLNAEMDAAAGTVTYHDNTHLGIAVDTPRGLLVPVVRDADELNVAGLAHRIADLAVRTRDNKVTLDELSGGTFTLTNTGSRGALFDTPILNIPQSAILGTGAVVKRPVVMTDESGSDVIAIRSMAYFAITYDHRLVDGADAARFLAAVKTRLEEGAFESDLH
jgi:pyruvate dehydrogenase E2 component (dihydrolipoamide acetyltransferase)